MLWKSLLLSFGLCMGAMSWAGNEDIGCNFSDLVPFLRKLVFRKWNEEAIQRIKLQQLPSDALHRLFRNEGISRQWMVDHGRAYTPLLLDVFFDSVIGFTAEAMATHSLSPKETPEYWQLCTPYLGIMGVMDSLRKQNAKDDGYRGSWFHGKGFEGKVFADLGAGYPRMGMFLGLTFPGLKYMGYEINRGRVLLGHRTAQKLGLTNVTYIYKDLADPNFMPEGADYYFMYDPFDRETRRKVFADLKKIALSTPKPIRIVVITGWSDEIYDDLMAAVSDGWLTLVASSDDSPRKPGHVRIGIAESLGVK